MHSNKDTIILYLVISILTINKALDISILKMINSSKNIPDNNRLFFNSVRILL